MKRLCALSPARPSILLGTVLALGLTSTGWAQQQESSGYELLERTARTYQDLTEYLDRGTIERTRSDGARQVFDFETRRNGRDFEWLLKAREGGAWKRIWRTDQGVFEYESGLNQYRPVPSLTAALAGSLGADGYDALLVPVALAGSTEPFEDALAVAVDEPGPCRPDSPQSSPTECRRLELTRPGMGPTTEIWIDSAHRIRRVLVRRQEAGLEARRVPRFDLPKRSPKETILIVTHEPTSGSTEPRDPAGGALAHLPTNAARVEDWQLPKEGPHPEDFETFTDEITVRLVRFRVYAVNRLGEPLSDLKPEDFEASWGSASIPVMSVEWHDAKAQQDLSPLDRAEMKALGYAAPVEGRRAVIFVQSAVERIRKTGHRLLLQKLDKILDAFGEEDRISVVSFDSHLKLWLDWTDDRQAVGEVLRQAGLGFGAEPRLRFSRDPNDLSAVWDTRAAKKAASPERALELTARALEKIPGEKLMIYLGWGLGRFGRDGVRMTREYDAAVEALEAAHTSVFVLDVTDADYHSLEIGLQSVAEATGGAYYRTRHFAEQSIRRLASTLSGHYVVTLDGSILTEAQTREPERGVDLRLLRPKSELLGPPLALQ